MGGMLKGAVLRSKGAGEVVTGYLPYDKFQKGFHIDPDMSTGLNGPKIAFRTTEDIAKENIGHRALFRGVTPRGVADYAMKNKKRFAGGAGLVGVGAAGMLAGGALAASSFKKKEKQLSARDELSAILFEDPRPRNALGMFSGGGDGGPNPQSMAITYQPAQPQMQPPMEEGLPPEEQQAQQKPKKIVKRDTQMSARETLDEITFARGAIADLAGMSRGNIAIPRGEQAAAYQADALRLVRNNRIKSRMSQTELTGHWRFANAGQKGSRQLADKLKSIGLRGRF
jgi:hypothetical protein